MKWTTSLNSNTGGTTSRYASPVITAANTVIAPTQIAGGAFQLNAFTGSTGASLYALSTDYVAPTSTTTPVYQPLLVNTASGTRLYYAGAGGTILYIASPDSATPGTPVRQVFYTTLSDYQTRAASFNSTVFINTPLTADANGNVFFGFRVQGTAPSPLSAQDGFARIDTNGNGTFVLAGTAAADATATHDAQNSAPALSNDGTTVYFAAKSASTDNYAYLARTRQQHAQHEVPRVPHRSAQRQRQPASRQQHRFAGQSAQTTTSTLACRRIPTTVRADSCCTSAAILHHQNAGRIWLGQHSGCCFELDGELLHRHIHVPLAFELQRLRRPGRWQRRKQSCVARSDRDRNRFSFLFEWPHGHARSSQLPPDRLRTPRIKTRRSRRRCCRGSATRSL